MKPLTANFLYRLLFVAYIVWASVNTLLNAHQLAAGHANPRVIYALAGTEVVAAIAFLIRPIELWAGGLLLLVFAIAALHTIVAGEAPVHLLFYAGTVVWILYLSRRVFEHRTDTAPR